jgi:macrolide-specific efflux system membrane fusion protein
MKLTCLVILVIAAATVAFSRAEPGQSAPGNQSAPGKTAADKQTPGKQTSDKLVLESALITVIEAVEIPAKVEGVLATVEAREGRMVESGTVLARIEDAEARLAHQRAGIEFEIAEKQAKNDLKSRVARKAFDFAKIELKRAEDASVKIKATVSETEIDRLRLAAQKAELEIDQAIHEQETALLTSRLKETEMQLTQQAVDRRTIRSPISGMVVQVNAQRGEWVPAGKAVVRVLRVDRLRVIASVHAKFLMGDLVGRRVTLAVDLPGTKGTEFEGDVVFVSPEANPVSKTVEIWAEVENKKLMLRPGLSGNLTIYPGPAATARRE